MTEKALSFDRINADTFRTSDAYASTFEHVRQVMVRDGGTIKKDDISAGVLEAAWRYGVNLFGLRVTVQFRTLAESQIEIHFKGGFSDAVDTTGAGQKKARELASIMSSTYNSPNHPIMPPRIGDASVANRGKRKTVAGLLAILFGGLGVHKFYLGNWGLGLLYIGSIFIIPYVSAIVGLVEGIRLFTLSESDFNEKYNYKNVQPFDVIW